MSRSLTRSLPAAAQLTLIRAYGEHNTLRELCNLVLIMGNRDSIDAAPSGAKRVLTDVLKLVDGLDLWGSCSFPKHHRQEDVPDIYACAQCRRMRVLTACAAC